MLIMTLVQFNDIYIIEEFIWRCSLCKKIFQWFLVTGLACHERQLVIHYIF